MKKGVSFITSKTPSPLTLKSTKTIFSLLFSRIGSMKLAQYCLTFEIGSAIIESAIPSLALDALRKSDIQRPLTGTKLTSLLSVGENE